MSNERLLKRGQLAELTDERTATEAKARAHVQTMCNVFDDALNLPHMDLDMAMEAVKDMRILKERYMQVLDDIQALKKELRM